MGVARSGLWALAYGHLRVKNERGKAGQEGPFRLPRYPTIPRSPIVSLFVPKKEPGPRLGHELPRQRSSNALTSKGFLATHEATQAEYNDANE